MSKKSAVVRACSIANEERCVFAGKPIPCEEVFKKLRGGLLVSGRNAGDRELLTPLLSSFVQRNDMPTVVLSARLPRFHGVGLPPVVRIFSPAHPRYHPFLGMSEEQLFLLLRMAGEEMGIHQMDNVMVYAASVLQVVQSRYQLSLPALESLLERDDHSIAAMAENSIAAGILGNPQAGGLLRQICKYLDHTLSNISRPGTDTEETIQSGITSPGMTMLYTVSPRQKLMNTYLKEALYCALLKAPRLRVVLDEAPFTDSNDELLRFLLQQKQFGRIELVLLSRNARETVYGLEPEFENVILFPHDNAAGLEELSKPMFGSYVYHYPVLSVSTPQKFFVSLKAADQWQAATEERLRLRAVDLDAEHLAIRTSVSRSVYLLPVDRFLPRIPIQFNHSHT